MFFDVVTREIQAAPEELIIGAKSDRSVNYLDVRWPLYVPRQVNAGTGTSIIGYFKLQNGDVVSSKYSTSYVKNDYRYVAMAVPKRATNFSGPVLFRVEVIGQSGTISSLELELTVVDSLCIPELASPMRLNGATGSFVLEGGKIHSALPFRDRIGGDRSKPELGDFKWLSVDDEIRNIETIPPGIAITSPYRGLANFIADPYMFSRNKQGTGDWHITEPWKIQNDGIRREEIGANAVPPFESRIDVEAVHGLSEQKQYKGYQLLNLSTIVQTSWQVDGDLVTQVIDSTNASNFAGSIPEENFGDKITIHCDPTSTANVRVRITHAGGNSYIQSNNTGRLRTIDLSTYDGVTEVRIGVYGTAKGSFVKKPMVEYGSVAHEWEPYVGEIPSPNPTYPQEIVSVVNPKVTVKENILADTTIYDFSIGDNHRFGYKAFVKAGMVVSCNGVGDNWYNINLYETLDPETNVINQATKTLSLRESSNGTYIYRTYTPSVDRWVAIVYGAGVDEEFAETEMRIAKVRVDKITETTLSITLRSVGDIHDDLRLNEYGQAEVVRNIAELKISNYSGVGTNDDGSVRAYLEVPGGSFVSSKAIPMMCETRINIGYDYDYRMHMSAYHCNMTGFAEGSGFNVFIGYPAGTTISQARADVSANPINVYYSASAMPLTEPHPELTELLKSLRDISSDHTIVVTDEAGREVPWLSFYKSGIKEIYASRTGATASVFGPTAMPHNYLYQNDIEVAVDGITVSFDLKIDNPQALDDGRICILRTYDTYGIMLGTMDTADLLTGNKYDTDISQFVAGEWKRVSLTFTQADLKTDIPSGWNRYYAAISFELPKNGGIHIRKPSIDRGEEWVMDVDLTDYPEGSEVPVTILGYYVNTN